MLTRWQFTLNLKLRHFRQTIPAVGGKNITYSEFVLIALFTWHTKQMPSIILSFVAYPGLPYFNTLSHKRQYFQKIYANIMQFAVSK